MNNKFLSIFSGIGGSAFGAKAAGYELIGAVEFDSKIGDLYYQNHQSLVLFQDVKDVDPKIFPKIKKCDQLTVQLSPPCQEFSIANAHPDLNSSRALALDNCYHILDYLQPDRIIVENVKEYRHSAPMDRFRSWLEINDYNYIEQIVNCANTGVPQSRIRYFLMADRHQHPRSLPSTHSQKQYGQGDLWGNSLKPWVSWYEAIKDLIPEMQLTKLSGNQRMSVKSSGNVSTRFLIPTIGYHSDLPHIYPQDRLAPTVKAGMMSDRGSERKGCWRLVDGCDVREMSISGLARLQTFPDDLILSGNRAIDCSAIGNAIPPIVLQQILEECFV